MTDLRPLKKGLSKPPTMQLNPEILLRALKKAARGIPGFQLDRKEKIDVSTQLERYLTGYSETLEEESLKNCFPYLNCRILAADMKKACKNNRRQMEQLQEMIQADKEKNIINHSPQEAQENGISTVYQESICART